MLELKDIHKQYKAGTQTVDALNGVSLRFRKNEFVSVLGPSGCGTTTLLNIIGGLDRATSGELLIDGRSTRSYRDRDWDAYRNHAVGFVFQSYNLIGHQTVLSNVEMALTLSGVSRKERRERAREVLEKVGLGDQLDKKPSQLSGGQMQRVAIARALINDPRILLADEPTGALDTETGIQVMELLRQIASDRLVIMVTHNPELAEKYSTRIVRLLDGRVEGDSDPVPEAGQEEGTLALKRTGMSFFTALGLSLNNLLTKKTRTILVSFAGSIGIIGIALILAMSTGAQAYIDKVERETLASYPVTLTSEAMDMTGLADSLTEEMPAEEREEGKLYSGSIMQELLSMMMNDVKQNDLAAFKARIEGDEAFESLTSGISYSYSAELNVWADSEEGLIQVNPSTIFDEIHEGGQDTELPSFMNQAAAMRSVMSSYTTGMTSVFRELLDNREVLESQYEVAAGRWPESMDEVVLIVNRSGIISDYVLYTLGLKPRSELKGLLGRLANGEQDKGERQEYTYEDILSLTFRLVLPTEYYEKTASHWTSIKNDAEKLRAVVENGMTLKVVGVMMPAPGAVVAAGSGTVGYLSELTRYMIEKVNESEIVHAQKADPLTDVLRGMPFEETEFDINKVDLAQYEEFVNMVRMILGEDRLNEIVRTVSPTVGSGATYEENLKKLGVCDLAVPDAINIYPRDFEAKQKITEYIEAYNKENEAGGKSIAYTDYVGLLLSGVTDIVQAITYILVAFVAVSLFVSSIMIGVITYISVLERTKEIGILRALGASKRDISRVFNAETLIIGFAAGMLGIGVSLLSMLPINAIIYSLAKLRGLAYLPLGSCAALVAVSMVLTLIAGIIPSRFAARRDPVIALRSE
ncbi:MAG: ABC transporter ATP-binding protein/permease [Clostridia bacterium]|nr:ABC transporter ATP-binding protein/permease [Clostridia bacterium]